MVGIADIALDKFATHGTPWMAQKICWNGKIWSKFTNEEQKNAKESNWLWFE